MTNQPQDELRINKAITDFADDVTKDAQNRSKKNCFFRLLWSIGITSLFFLTTSDALTYADFFAIALIVNLCLNSGADFADGLIYGFRQYWKPFCSWAQQTFANFHRGGD